MSSVLRTKGVKKEGLTLFVKPESPTYERSDGQTVLFPFSYSNQVLDISYAGNNFESTMVDISGVSPDSETDTTYRIISGAFLVTSLGNNFKAYIRSWRESTIDVGSPIEIYVAPQVLRVQEGAPDNVSSNSGSSYIISDSVPKSENYITGTVANTYQTTYVFKTPLTFTTMEGGIKKYITFRTAFDQE